MLSLLSTNTDYGLRKLSTIQGIPNCTRTKQPEAGSILRHSATSIRAFTSAPIASKAAIHLPTLRSPVRSFLSSRHWDRRESLRQGHRSHPSLPPCTKMRPTFDCLATPVLLFGIAHNRHAPLGLQPSRLPICY